MGPKRQSLKNLAGVQDLNRKNTSFCRRPTYALCVFTVLFMLFYRGHASPNPVSPEEEILQLNATQLRVFQVYKPVPDEPSHEIPGGCNAEILLMRHEFGSSYGHPFVGKSKPFRVLIKPTSHRCNMNSHFDIKKETMSLLDVISTL